MKHFGEVLLGVLAMLLAVACVWEFTIIKNLQEDVKAKSLLIDAQAVRARNLEEQIVEKDNAVKLLTTTPQAAAPKAAPQPAPQQPALQQPSASQPVAPRPSAPQPTSQQGVVVK